LEKVGTRNHNSSGESTKHREKARGEDLKKTPRRGLETRTRERGKNHMKGGSCQERCARFGEDLAGLSQTVLLQRKEYTKARLMVKGNGLSGARGVRGVRLAGLFRGR